MTTVILWDLMDTLIRDPFFTHVADHFGTDLRTLATQLRPGTWPKFELNEIDEATLYEEFFLDGHTFDGPALKQCMVDNCAWLDGMPELLQALLLRDVPMHVLSNYPHWYEQYDQRLEVSSLVPLTFVSCETGHRKPSPDAFLGACRTLGVAAESCLLVDDREANVEAARAVGMDGLRFSGSVSRLRADLEAKGLL